MFVFLNLQLSSTEIEALMERLNYQSHSVRKSFKEKKNFDKNKSKFILKEKELENIKNDEMISSIKANIKNKFSIDV